MPILDSVPVPGEEPGLYYCYRHKREETRVTCGRCERPICTRCMVIGPAGVRCKICARGKVGVRPMGLAHDLWFSVKGAFGSISRTPGGYWIVYIVIMVLVSGSFCGRHR